MNKIYNVIWSHVKQCYVVTSELAKAHGRTSIGGASRLAVAALTAFILTAGVTSVGLAADPATDANIHYYSIRVTKESAEGNDSNYNNDGATGEGSIAIGPFASAKGNHSLALGYRAETTHLEGRNDQDDNTAVGYSSQVVIARQPWAITVRQLAGMMLHWGRMLLLSKITVQLLA